MIFANEAEFWRNMCEKLIKMLNRAAISGESCGLHLTATKIMTIKLTWSGCG